MNSQEIFTYWLMILVTLVFVTVLYIGFLIIKILRKAEHVIDSADQVTNGVLRMKQRAYFSLNQIKSIFLKGGDIKMARKSGISPMVSGAIGATVGAIGGVAAASALSDGRTRRKVGRVLSEVKDGAVEAVTEMRIKGKRSMKKLASQKSKVAKRS